MLQVVLLYVLGEIVHLKKKKKKNYSAVNVDILRGKKATAYFPPSSLTCTELVIVLRANTVAQSFMVDWLSNAP